MPSSFLNGFWLSGLFVALGLLPATWLTRALRLPRACWLPLVLASASAIAYAEFWVFFFWRLNAGAAASFVLLLSVSGFLVLALTAPDVPALLRHRDVWLPAALTCALTAAYLAYAAWAGVAPTFRFTVTLPPEDNVIPLMLADRLYYGYGEGRIPPPPITTVGWIVGASDRPPLQAAVVLSVRTLGLIDPRGKVDLQAYQVLATVCQMAWVPALYALGRTLGLRRRPLAFGIAGAAFSGFFLLQSLYTWPKMFGGWLFVFALTLIAHALRSTTVARTRVWTLAGGAAALALLAHGSLAFSVIALPVLALWRDVRRGLRGRDLVAAALACAFLLAPWSAYQRFYDPPGNHLTKMHLAGVMRMDDSRSTLRAMADEYGKLTFAEIVRARWENVRAQWLVRDGVGAGQPVTWAQWQQFHRHVPALDLLGLGLVLGLVRWRRRSASRAAPSGPLDLARVTVYALAALAAWIALLFSPGGAVMQHASFGTTALLFFCGAAWLATLPSWLGAAAMAAHALVFAGVWLPMRTLPSGPQPIWSLPWAVVMTTSCLAFVVLLSAIPEPDVEAERGARGEAA